jgi:cation:H+ antiporter
VTTTDEDLHEDIHPGRQQLSLALAVGITLPGIFLRLTEPHLEKPLEALIFGLAIVGAAFLLSWAAEAAQLDISAGLAIAVLAFIAVLPEYAVDLVFAVKGGNAYEASGYTSCEVPGQNESPCSLALANMTGANRLLIGIGWSSVVFVAAYRYRKLRNQKMEGITLERSHSVELAYLSIATAYSLTLPMKTSITLFDAAILVSIFIAYTVRISRAPAEEPHLVGPARLIGSFSTRGRRITVVTLFVFAAFIILMCAEHFAEALVETGATLGISEFFLVQWLAPLASEAPELLVALLYAWRLNTNAGLGTLVSSKVNQWTLLVGTLPIAFAISSSSTHGLPIIDRQREELLLTAAQSIFAVAVLLNLSLSVREAGFLFTLFWAQFLAGAIVPEDYHDTELLIFSGIYLVLAAQQIIAKRRVVPVLLKDGFRTPYTELAEEPA